MIILPMSTASQVRINKLRAKVNAYIAHQDEQRAYYLKHGRVKPIEVVVYDQKKERTPSDSAKSIGIFAFVLATTCLGAFLIHLFS